MGGDGAHTRAEADVTVPHIDQEERGGEFGHGDGPKKDFVPSSGLTSDEVKQLLSVHGRNELEEKVVPKWLVFLKLLIQPMPIMIWIAVIVQAAIQNWLDMGILLGIQFANATIGWYETTKSADAVAALKASLKPIATAKRDGKWQKIDAGELVPGDLVLLGSGSAVPADCIINHGQIDVDQSALTGESLPVTLFAGDGAKMGSTITRGEVEGTVEFTGKHTFFGKTASLLQTVDELGNIQKILLQLMVVLVGISLLLCGIAFGYMLSKGETLKHALEFTVVLLVASIPLAIEIVVTATLALGSRQLSAHGAIVTRLTAIEEMAGMNMLCSDKTGTLTLNKMVIQDDTPVYVPNMDQAELLRMAGLAARWKEPPRDALDTLVLTTVDLASLDAYEQVDFLPFDPTIKRTEGTLRGPDGKVFKTTKGAPHIIAKLCKDQEVVAKVNKKVHELGLRGVRSLAVARTNDAGEWLMLGILTFLDPPRPDTKDTIEKSMAFGVDVKMITGDHTVIAKETCRMLGLGTNIANAKGLPLLEGGGKVPDDLGKKYGQMILEADGFAEVFPEHKYIIVEALRQEGFAVGMTGDGVNDAPALKRADVGIAVQGATDAARAAADIVLTQPGLSVLVHAIVVARQIFRRIKSFINYRIAATLQLLVFFFIAVLAMQPPKYTAEFKDEHFFKLPVLMLMLITLLNDGTLISVGYDNAVPSQRPDKWNLKVVWLVSVVLGLVACISSLVLLHVVLDSYNPSGVIAKMGIPPVPYPKVITLIYLKVSVSDFLTLFSSRTVGWFWSSRPGNLLLAGAGTALSISTALACAWPEGDLHGIKVQGLALGEYRLWALWVWLYCLVWWLIQDGFKVLTYKLVEEFNLFDANTDALVNVRAAHTFDDPNHKLARVSAGMVDSKLLQMKVDNARRSIDGLVKQGKAPAALARVSQQLAQTHNLARTSISAAMSTKDVESAAGLNGDVAIQQSIARLQEAMQDLPESARQEIRPHLEGVQAAAQRVGEISTSLARKSQQ